MKILLLTDIPPCTNHTAGIVINKWCDFLIEDGHNITCALVKSKCVKVHIPYDKKKNIKFLLYEKPFEDYVISEYGFVNYMRSFLTHKKIRNDLVPKLGDKILSDIESEKIDLILCCIQGETITYLLDYIAKKSRIEYVSQTWDPIEWWIKANKFDSYSSKLLLNKFDEVVTNSKNFMSMSWEMTKEFERKYHVQCITNIPSLAKENSKERIVYKDNNYHIGFSGQVYSIEEFDLLFEVLEEMNWKYKNKTLFLDLFGAHFNEKYLKCKNVNYYGYLPQDGLITELKKMDLLYCPYWFNVDYDKPCRLSFPGKLTSYLKTGVPILMHSPKYSSPYLFLKKFKIGYYCNSLRKNDLKNTLIYIIENNFTYNSQKQIEVFNKYLTYSTMKECLEVSLGIKSRKEIEYFEKLK